MKKKDLFADTVLRRDGDGNIFLMNHPKKGWRSLSIPIPSESYLLDRFNVKLGQWTSDKFGECCPVIRINIPEGSMWRSIQ